MNISSNVALVGSSSTLLDREYGELIDEHDTVIRFNHAQIEGYQKHVGHKTTIRISNPHVIETNKYRKMLGEEFSLINVEPYRNSLIREITKEGIEGCPVAKQLTCMYTVGMTGILLCVFKLQFKPSLFGFSTDMDRRRTHYWEEKEFVPNSNDHSPTLEQKLILELEAADKVKIYR